jgi:hypothetical protein
MPSLRHLGLDQNPSEQPLSYPGRAVPGSCLLVSSWLYYLLSTRSTIAEWPIEYEDGGPLCLARTHQYTPINTLSTWLCAP